MAIYYIDQQKGSNKNDGLSENSALMDDKNICPQPGDKILFKRGSFFRGRLNNVSGEEGKPITYGAYGKGDNPIFCGSVDLSDPSLWKETEKNIWVCDLIKNDEVGNIIFGDTFATLRWSKEELLQQGDFYDNCFGYGEAAKEYKKDHKIYLYSVKNPGVYYNSIECATYGDRRLASNGHDMIFENITFINSGVHAIAGAAESRNLTVRHCIFKNIGGCVWSCDLKVRFGNGVEMWNIAENIEVSNCVFDNIYDSGVTHQGSCCEPTKNLIIKNNVFNKCGMAAYEQRDILPKYTVFNNNICINAGEGFSKQGEIMPRKSEIWPQPMGHHIFLWRIDKPTDDARFEIKNNVFMDAPYGCAVYSIIDKKAEMQIDIDYNVYKMNNKVCINRFFGTNFTELDEFKKSTGKDINSILIK